MMIWTCVCLVNVIITIIGMYRCVIPLMVVQTIFLLVSICINIAWVLVTKTWALLLLLIIYGFSAHTFYRLYKWAKFFKSGEYKHKDSPYPE